jgi:hypothetical protein
MPWECPPAKHRALKGRQSLKLKRYGWCLACVLDTPIPKRRRRFALPAHSINSVP